MKILSLYVFLILLWCNVGVAEKINLICKERTNKYPLPSVLILDMKLQYVFPCDTCEKESFYIDDRKILWSDAFGLTTGEKMVVTEWIDRIEGWRMKTRHYVDEAEYKRLAKENNEIVLSDEKDWNRKIRNIFHLHYNSKKMTKKGIAEYQQENMFDCKKKESVF